MRIAIFLAAIFLTLASYTPANAQEKEGVWVTYYIKDSTNEVTGLMQIAEKDGKEVTPASYSIKRISNFIAYDCAGGKVGQIKLGKQQSKRKWGFVRQKFTTTCEGGPHSRIGATSGSVQVQVKRQANGRDEAEYFFGINGDMVTVKKKR